MCVSYQIMYICCLLLCLLSVHLSLGTLNHQVIHTSLLLRAHKIDPNMHVLKSLDIHMFCD